MKPLTAEQYQKTFHAYHCLCGVMDNPIPNKRLPMSRLHYEDIDDFAETGDDVLHKVKIADPAPVISNDLRSKINLAIKDTMKGWRP